MTLSTEAASRKEAHPARIGHLDGIRALAIVSVMSFHWTKGVFQGGYIGVDVFLVLSGYLITSILIRRRERSTIRGYLTFVRARVQRLYPALLGTVLGVFVMTMVGRGDAIDLLRPTAASYTVTLLQVSWIPVIGHWGPHSQLLIHTWTLAVEWAFYALWPWLLWRVVLDRRRSWLIVGAASVALWLLCAALLPWEWFYASPLARAAQLGAGCALALYAAPRGGGARVFASMSAARAETIFLISLVFVTAWTLLGPDAGVTYRWGVFAAVPLATLGMIAGGYRSKSARWLVSVPMVRQIGLASYSIYLWHVPWMLLCSHDALGISRTAAALAMVTLTALTASASYWWLERPYFRMR